MEAIPLVCLGIIFLAFAFDYINGFHDTANAIATVVSTRVLSPKAAIIMASCLNFVGALMGTHVASTIGKGIISMEAVNNSQMVIFSALVGAIVWNLLTWWFGLPSSSSHALFGGMMGSAATYGLFYGVKTGQILLIDSILQKIILPIFASPMMGFIAGFTLMLGLSWILYFLKTHPVKIKNVFGKLQIASSALMALSHGTNDAQKSMGIITMALFAGGLIGTMEVPLWVKIGCALVMAAGTASGGWRIIKTMGHKIFKLETIHGFAAETSAAFVIFIASHFGAPISTTQVISSSILGVGSTKRLSAVKWGIAGNIAMAWIFTIPASALIGGAVFSVFHLFGWV